MTYPVPDEHRDAAVHDISSDELYDRIDRDRWAGGHILRGDLPRAVTVPSLPTATQELRHCIVVVPGASTVADKLYVCAKNASDTYEWKLVGITAQASTTDIKDVLVNIGALTDGGVTPLNLDGGAITSGNISAGSVTAASGVAITAGGFFHTTGTVQFWNTGGQASKPTLNGTYTGTLAQLQTAFHNLTQLLANYGLLTDSTA